MVMKPEVDVGRAAAVVERLTGPITTIVPLSAGYVAQAFLAQVGGERLVVRFSKHDRHFGKDAVAHDLWAGGAVPIPAVLEIGRDGDLHYAVSEWAPGVHFDGRMSAAGRAGAAAALVETLETIHASDISATSGYGVWHHATLTGKHPTWPDAVRINVDQHDVDALATWREQFGDDRLLSAAIETLERLLRFCHEERHLVHGDYGGDNVLIDGDRMSAVLDWGNSVFGDPLFDIAWLQTHNVDGHRIGSLYRASHPDLVHVDERIACYTLHIAIGVGIWCAGENLWDYQRTMGELAARVTGLTRPGRDIAI